ncbi:MAG: hypothetical protein ACRDO4_15475 [Nocardioides sp.]
MFANRLRLVAAGAALVMSASLAVSTSATAEPAAAQAKEERTITIHGSEPRPNVFIVKGRVSPEYANKRATVQRKLRSANTWKGWKAFRTNDNSRYRQRIAPLRRRGVVCYRIKVKGNATYKTSYSGRVCIKTF